MNDDMIDIDTHTKKEDDMAYPFPTTTRHEGGCVLEGWPVELWTGVGYIHIYHFTFYSRHSPLATRLTSPLSSPHHLPLFFFFFSFSALCHQIKSFPFYSLLFDTTL